VIYLSLFTISFLAATILPFSSELTLGGLIATSNYNNLLLLIVTSFGNVLGSVVNWARLPAAFCTQRQWQWHWRCLAANATKGLPSRCSDEARER
jgi:membrane protein YqaA with SNARE-associated domain